MRNSLGTAIALGFLLAVGETIPPGGVALGLAKTDPKGRFERGLKVTAYVYNYAHLEPVILALAENEATRIFQHAGLRIVWRDVPISSLESRSAPRVPLDEPALGLTDVFLKIVPSSLGAALGQGKEALGCALPSSKRRAASDAWVFYDRVEEAAGAGTASRHQILGSAMAHEVGHLLLGPDSHSLMGIMRGDWRPKDFVIAGQGSLLFTPYQAKVIRAEVRARIRQQNAGFSPGK